MIDQRGARIEWTYDDLDRARTMTHVVRQPSGPDEEYTTTYDYDDLGNQTSVTDPESNETESTYSAASELLTVTDPLSEVTSYAYDVAGRQIKVTDPLGRYVEWTYDLAGRRTVEQHRDSGDALEAEYEWTHDGNGNVVSSESARGYVTDYTYDALNRLIEVEVPIDATPTTIVTSYGYDAGGNVTRFTDGESNITIYTYQEWGLQEDVIEPSTTQHTALADRTWTTVYDAGGLAVEERQPGGVTIARTFDQLGRLTQESGSGTGVTSATRTFGYDKAGLRISMSHPDGAITFTYDDRGLLIDTDHPGGTIGDATFGYDDAGRITERVDEAGTTTFTWTGRNELNTLADPVTGITLDWDWDDAGQPTSIEYGTGSPPAIRTFTWDDLGRLDTDTLVNTSSATVVEYEYGYDVDGNVTSIDVDLGGNSLDGAHSYAYDYAGRVTSWTDPNTTTVTYTFDNAGNRTAAGNDSFTFDARNRLVTSPDGDLTYDARGTVNDIDGTGYDFDALGRLLTVGTVDFTYDSLDRIATREATDFIYTGQMMDPTTDGTNTWSRTPAGRLIAQDDGTNDRLIGLNRHGDQSWLFGTTGTVAATTVYDPFGVAAATTGGGGSPLGFQGDYTDPTFGEVWMGARWYSAADAGFRSRDTVFGELATSVSLNRYTYAANNPLLYWDPTGRYAEYIEGLDGPTLSGGVEAALDQSKKTTKLGSAQRTLRDADADLKRGPATAPRTVVRALEAYDVVGDQLGYRSALNLLSPALRTIAVRSGLPIGSATSGRGLIARDIGYETMMDVASGAQRTRHASQLLGALGDQTGVAGGWPLVNSGGVVYRGFDDIKSRIETSTDVKGGPGPVDDDAYFPVGVHGYEYHLDIWGNIGGGFAAASVGIPPSLVNYFAGLRGFEDPIDARYVQLGAELWARYGMSLTADQLEAVVVTSTPEILKIQAEVLARDPDGSFLPRILRPGEGNGR